MLRIETESKTEGNSSSRARRWMTALVLLALTIGVATLRGPARASDDAPALAAQIPPKKKGADVVEGLPPFNMNYVTEGKLGVLAFRPSATLARLGMMPWMSNLRRLTDENYSMLAKELGLEIDVRKPGFLKLGVDGIESVVGTFDIGSQQRKGRDPKLGDRPLYTLETFESGMMAVRTVAPFDWLAFLRQWKLDLEEVREARGVYYRIKNEPMARAGVHLAIYLPDDRTIVYEKEEVIKQLIAREVPTAPAYLRGAEWERASRGLVAFAMDTHGDGIAKRMNLGRPEDAPILAFFQGVDRLMLGVEDADAIILQAEVAVKDPQAAETVAKSIKTLLTLGQAALALAPGEAEELAPLVRMAKGFLSTLQIRQEDNSVAASADGFGTFADLATFLKSIFEEGSGRVHFGERAKAQEAKARAKNEKR